MDSEMREPPASDGVEEEHELVDIEDGLRFNSTLLHQRWVRESRSQRIDLIEDDPKHVGILVEYLYKNDFWVNGHPMISASNRQVADELAGLYVFAQRYLLDGMTALIVKKLEQRTLVHEPNDWLRAAEKIYSANSDNDTIFLTWLRASIIELKRLDYENPNQGLAKILDTWVAKGGKLAVAILHATEIFVLQTVAKQSSAIHKSLGIRNDEARRHTMAHPRCRGCFTRGQLDENHIFRMIPNYHLN
ncbi:MAG: hypothetical protein Q9181_006591 [Wetmoreana brouardii]